MKKIFLIGILSMVLMNCNNDDNNEFPQNMSFTTLIKGGFPALEGEIWSQVSGQKLVIQNENEWSNLLSILTEDDYFSSSFTETEINFNTCEVVAIFSEQSNVEVEVIYVVENEDKVTLTYQTTYGAAAVITTPYHIVKIPKSGKEVVFVVQEQD